MPDIKRAMFRVSSWFGGGGRLRTAGRAGEPRRLKLVIDGGGLRAALCKFGPPISRLAQPEAQEEGIKSRGKISSHLLGRGRRAHSGSGLICELGRLAARKCVACCWITLDLSVLDPFLIPRSGRLHKSIEPEQ